MEIIIWFIQIIFKQSNFEPHQILPLRSRVFRRKMTKLYTLWNWILMTLYRLVSCTDHFCWWGLFFVGRGWNRCTDRAIFKKWVIFFSLAFHSYLCYIQNLEEEEKDILRKDRTQQNCRQFSAQTVISFGF